MNHTPINDHELVNAHIQSIHESAKRVHHLHSNKRPNIFSSISRLRKWLSGRREQAKRATQAAPPIQFEDAQQTTTQELFAVDLDVQYASTK